MTEHAVLTEHFAAGLALHRQGNLLAAEQHYLAVLELDPRHGEALKLLSVIALEHGNVVRAAELAEAALAVQPKSGEYFHLLGRIKIRQGDLRAACRYLNSAVDAGAPEQGQALLDLSASLGKLKAWPESLAAAQRALASDPTNLLARRLAGHACFALDRHEEALAHFEHVLSKEPAQHSLWHLTSVSLLRLGRPVQAHERAVKACVLVDDNADYAYQRRSAAAAAVPDWHFNMVNDEPRNAAFSAAIAQVVKPEHRVLEIGTGSGLLAMLAARAESGEPRAADVVTCEANPLLARIAKQIVEVNGLSDRVKVVAKPSSEVQLGLDLPAKADVLICEIFSVQVIAEGVLPTLEDAKARLLAPQASVIPSAAIARGALVSGDELARRTRVGTVHGLDLSALNEYTPTVQYLSSEQPLTLLSAPADLLRFDLAHNEHFPAEKRAIQLRTTASGLCQGVVQWLRLELCTGVDFENQPGSAEAATSRHWQPVFYPFAEPIQVAAGELVTLRVSHNRRGMHVVLNN